eukprot:scaffold4656_cov117-Isochrysis_galbana.AAC.3
MGERCLLYRTTTPAITIHAQVCVCLVRRSNRKSCAGGERGVKRGQRGARACACGAVVVMGASWHAWLRRGPCFRWRAAAICESHLSPVYSLPSSFGGASLAAAWRCNEDIARYGARTT